MCGIFGQTGALNPGQIERVSATLRSRGPDAEGVQALPGITLVHRRLRVIDLSPSGDQPLRNEDGTVWVVFNGEIYNHHELRSRLRRAGHVFRGGADTEVIVHAYEEWGDEAVELLDGMFAFGLWDARKKRLLLARDRAGKKPLYYSTVGGVVRFGSSVAALHAAGLPRRPNLDALPFLLRFGFCAAPMTAFADALQLAPASRLVFEDGTPRSVVRYWTPEFGRCGAEGKGTLQEATREVRRRVETAVERRLESDVPLGAFLSGGIDSTIVVGVAARALGAGVATFSVGFRNARAHDETSFARIAARAFATKHTEIVLDEATIAKTFPETMRVLVDLHDGPFGDSSALPTYLVAAAARKEVTVALSGDGGDEVYCGYLRFLAAEATEHVPPFGRALAATTAGLLRGRSSERSAVARAGRLLGAAALPLDERLASWTSYFAAPEFLMQPDLAARLGEAMTFPAEWHRRTFAESTAPTVLARVMEHNFRTQLPFDILVKADRASMAHGLELRSPFLDTDVVRHASSLPAAYLRRGTYTKRVLRHAFRDVLPPEIAGRGKMGFGVPLASWFRGALRSQVTELTAPGMRCHEILRRDAIAKLVDDHLAGREDHGQRLWLLLTVEAWLRS